MACFSALMDQITAYQSHPDPVYYVTKFLDRLKPVVRLLVAIQKPVDLDAAYSLSLLYEELGDDSSILGGTIPSPPVPRRSFQPPPSSTSR